MLESFVQSKEFTLVKDFINQYYDDYIISLVKSGKDTKGMEHVYVIQQNAFDTMLSTFRPPEPPREVIDHSL